MVCESVAVMDYLKQSLSISLRLSGLLRVDLQVVRVDEKGCADSMFSQNVENERCSFIWAVIKSQIQVSQSIQRLFPDLVRAEVADGVFRPVALFSL